MDQTPQRPHIFWIDGVPSVEAYHLATWLGYQQPHLIRKQIETAWPHLFQKGTHYDLILDDSTLEAYERDHKEGGYGSSPKTKAGRGRMFLRSEGLEELLEHTTKNKEALRNLVENLSVSETPRPISTPPVVPARGPDLLHQKSLEERKFEHQVLEKLLENLNVLNDPLLRDLALASAERALGQKLEKLRAKLFKHKTVLEQPSPTFSLSEIGKMAGNYSARAAGKAASIVGGRMGLTPGQLRRQKQPFNELLHVTDSRGTPRPVVRFRGSFVEQVVAELQANPLFTPTEKDLEFVDANRVYPQLSKNPLEEDEAFAR